MDWKIWIGKKVFIQTEGSKLFGKVVEVTDSSDGLIWIGFYNSNGKFILLRTTEIIKIEEIE